MVLAALQGRGYQLGHGAAQLVICDKAAISGGGDLEKMIGQLVSHIEGVNI